MEQPNVKKVKTVDTNESAVPSHHTLFIPYRLRMKDEGE